MRKRKPITSFSLPSNFIEEAPDKTFVSKSGNIRKRRRVKLRCLHCTSVFEIDLDNAVRTQQKCCSTSCYYRLTEHFEGGNEKHPLYARWLSMTQRCTNPNSANYPRYGGRGITIEPFFSEFKNYVEYCLSLPNAPKEFPCPSLQIDRRDNNGNYERGNLRWVSQRIQSTNQRKKSSAKHSKYIGVTYSSFHNKWIGCVRHYGKVLHTKTYDSELEAAVARDNFIKDNGLDNALNNL